MGSVLYLNLRAALCPHALPLVSIICFSSVITVSSIFHSLRCLVWLECGGYHRHSVCEVWFSFVLLCSEWCTTFYPSSPPSLPCCCPGMNNWVLLQSAGWAYVLRESPEGVWSLGCDPVDQRRALSGWYPRPGAWRVTYLQPSIVPWPVLFFLGVAWC